MLFRRLSLALNGGDALHITGSNGIGKSSLIRILSGLLQPYDGTVERKGAVSLLNEHPALDPQAPLADGLAFWGGIDSCNGPHDIAFVLGIEELLDVPFRYLSTGQRKRAAFVRLLNQSAPIWLLDEPLNGLDIDAQERITSLIKLHCGGGGICVIASHQSIDLPEASIIDLEGFVL